MDWRNALMRARRGFREDAKLHGVAISSLLVAFLCLGASLLATTNLSRVAERWRGSGRLTVYLAANAGDADIERLRGAIERLPEVRSAELISAADARAAFMRDTQLGLAADALPDDIFPASIDVALKPGIAAQRVAAMAARLDSIATVEDVETYRSFFDRLDALLFAGRLLAIALGALVLFCVFAVVGNTIRLAVSNRRSEVEVLKLCGATDNFVRGPFIVEGAMQGLLSSTSAVVLLFLGYMFLRSHVDSTFTSLTGLHTVFLHPAMMLGLLFAGVAGGVLGSMLSLRRYLEV